MAVDFKTIVFPVDFSERCRGAAHYVEAIAEKFGSRVILLHVLETTIGQPGDLNFGGLAASIQWEEREARAKELMRTFLAGDLAIADEDRRVEPGDPARTIMRVAADEAADLIVMPTHGYGPFRRFILGSVTAKVLHDAQCAVFTGAHMENSPPPEAIQIRRVLCALDLVGDNTKLLETAVDFAKTCGAELAVCHAVPGSEALPERIMDCELRRHLMADARERMHQMIQTSGISASVLVDSGEVARVIEMKVRDWQADVLVIGRSRQKGFGRLRTHSYSIIRESPCPVLSL